MNIPSLFTIAAVSAELAFGVSAEAKEKHEEEIVSQADVPVAVQQAAGIEAKGGRIVRWEKEGRNYEAVIEKSGKKWGVEINDRGKVLNKHDEATEKH
jgi:plastocyanin